MNKTNEDKEDSEELMNWGSPINKTTECTKAFENEIPSGKVSTVLDFLDEEDEGFSISKEFPTAEDQKKQSFTDLLSEESEEFTGRQGEVRIGTSAVSSAESSAAPEYINPLSQLTTKHSPLTTKFSSSNIIKFLGSKILRHLVKPSIRASGNSLVQKPVSFFSFLLPILPSVSDSSFRNKIPLEMATLSIKDPSLFYSKIKAILKIKDTPIFSNDLVISIGKDSLNALLPERNILFESQEELFSSISGPLTPLEANIIKYKMGLPYSFMDSEISVNFLKGILYANIPELTLEFIKQQKERIIYLVLFYKAGMVDKKRLEPLYQKNLYYRYVLGKAGLSEAKVEKGGWLMRSIVDFGISKILNVEKGNQQSPLESVQCPVIGSVQVPVQDQVQYPVEHSPVQAQALLESLPVQAPVQAPTPVRAQAPTPIQAPTTPPKNPVKSIFDESDDEDIFPAEKPTSNTFYGEESTSLYASTPLYAPVEFNPEDGKINQEENKEEFNQEEITMGDKLLEEETVPVEETMPVEECDNAVSLTQEDNIVNLTREEEAGREGALIGSVTAPTPPAPPTAPIGEEALTTPPTLYPKEAPEPQRVESPQLYKKKFSKSFADIFTLGDQEPAPSNLDLSSYVPDVSEGDKPISVETEEKSSVLSSIFGIFKKKPVEQHKAKPDIMQERMARPLKAELQAPEKKERKVIQSSYANMKNTENIEIPGFKPVRKKD